MKQLLALVTGMAILFTGCAPPGDRQLILPPVQITSYTLVSQFSSALPEDYAVLVGQVEPNKPYRVNEHFEAALQRLVRQKSGSSRSQVVEVQVHIESLHASFQQLGPTLPWRVPAEPGKEKASLDIPDEIIKSARLQLTLDVRSVGKVLRRDRLVVDYAERIYREEFDRSVYSFKDVIFGVMAKSLGRIDGLLDAALVPRKGSQMPVSIRPSSRSGLLAGY